MLIWQKKALRCGEGECRREARGRKENTAPGTPSKGNPHFSPLEVNIRILKLIRGLPKFRPAILQRPGLVYQKQPWMKSLSSTAFFNSNPYIILPPNPFPILQVLSFSYRSD
ncbi:hypothetical protein L1887_19170 [Cichorium endivia]|nr:hypothetical protein L1887_19170 [Cichorium endivia]